jgi:membrane fusion protein, heavy metal efflux system
MILLSLALIAGCSQQSGHTEGDGHDHGSEKGSAAAPVKDEHSANDSHSGEGGHGHGEEDHSSEPVTLSAEQAEIAGIVTERVTRTRLQGSIVVPGTIAPTTGGRAVVTPTVSGRVVRISVALGQAVRAGQVLAVIESTELAEAWSRITEAARARDEVSSRLTDAETQARSAEARLAATRQTLKRQREFAAAGAFMEAPLQLAQSELNDAESDLLSAQRDQASHAEQLRRLESLFRDGLVSRSDLEAARLKEQQDQIRVSREKSRVATAKSAYDRERRISDQGLLNAREIQTAESEVRNAEIELDRARSAVRTSRALLATADRAVANARIVYRTFSGGAPANAGRVNLIAPLPGVVTHIDVTRGQAVDRTQSLFEVENLNAVWATAQVPERDSAGLRKGSAVLVVASAMPSEEFEGTVSVVASRIDPKTRTLAVQCLLANDRLRLKPEMFVTVRIWSGSARPALTVPDSAIVTDAGQAYVFVKQDQGFVRHEVRTGASASGRTEVLSGLEPGEEVAVKGAFVLKSQQQRDELKGHEH